MLLLMRLDIVWMLRISMSIFQVRMLLLNLMLTLIELVFWIKLSM